MGRKASIRVLVASLCLAAVPALCGPLQKNEVGPGANWVVHADVEAFRNSSLGKLIMAELQTQGLDEKLQNFATIFSFHPLKDVRDVTLYGKGRDRNNAVVIIDGQFDPEKLLAVVRWNQQYQEIPHQGVTLHGWLNEEKKGDTTTSQMMYGYIHAGRQVAVSSGLDALKQAADTLRSPGAGISSGLLSQIPEGPANAFFQAAAVGVGKIVGEDPKAVLLKQADLFTFAAGETADKVFAELRLRGESAEVADNMVKLFQGVVAAAVLAGEGQPKLSELAKSVSVSRADRVIQVRFEAQSQAVFGFLKEQWEQKQQQKQTQ
jgi:hypothetical protein